MCSLINHTEVSPSTKFVPVGWPLRISGATHGSARTMAYAAEDFHCLLDGELFLPQSWSDDRTISTPFGGVRYSLNRKWAA